jgi:hypothetical protein
MIRSAAALPLLLVVCLCRADGARAPSAAAGELLVPRDRSSTDDSVSTWLSATHGFRGLAQQQQQEHAGAARAVRARPQRRRTADPPLPMIPMLIKHRLNLSADELNPFLLPAHAFPIERGICGQWVQDYIRLHNDILAGRWVPARTPCRQQGQPPAPGSAAGQGSHRRQPHATRTHPARAQPPPPPATTGSSQVPLLHPKPPADIPPPPLHACRRPARYTIMTSASSGLADRLVSATSIFLHAVLTGRAFQYEWRGEHTLWGALRWGGAGAEAAAAAAAAALRVGRALGLQRCLVAGARETGTQGVGWVGACRRGPGPCPLSAAAPPASAGPPTSTGATQPPKGACQRRRCC